MVKPNVYHELPEGFTMEPDGKTAVKRLWPCTHCGWVDQPHTKKPLLIGVGGNRFGGTRTCCANCGAAVGEDITSFVVTQPVAVR